MLILQAKLSALRGENQSGERVGVRQQSAYFIHGVAINFLFSVAKLQRLSDLCVHAIIWVAEKMFWFNKTWDGWRGGAGWGHYNHCPDLEMDLRVLLLNTHKRWLPLMWDSQHCLSTMQKVQRKEMKKDSSTIFKVCLQITVRCPLNPEIGFPHCNHSFCSFWLLKGLF